MVSLLVVSRCGSFRSGGGKCDDVGYDDIRSGGIGVLVSGVVMVSRPVVAGVRVWW